MTDKTIEQLKAEWVAAIDAADVACGPERDSAVAARQAAYDAFSKALDAFRKTED